MSYEQPVTILGTEMEKTQALNDARNIIRERGMLITIRLYKEQKITRDKYNTIKKRNKDQITELSFYSFPIIFDPTTKQLENFGIRERVYVLVKTSMLDWIDNGFDMSTLKNIDSIRATVIINGAKYEIRNKQFDSQYQDTFLYIHLGLNRI